MQVAQVVGGAGVVQGSSPREFGANAEHSYGVTLQYSKLNDPALHSERSIAPYLQSTGGPLYWETDCEFQPTSAANTTPGSEPGTSGNSRQHPSQSPRDKFRYHPYPRSTGKIYTVNNCTPQIHHQSELDPEEETSSVYSQNDCGYSIDPTSSEHGYYLFRGDSINPQQLTVSYSQSVQNCYSTYTPEADLLSSFHATASELGADTLSNQSSDAAIGHSSDEDNIVQSVRDDSKKGGLKKSISRKDKKRGTKGSIKGVQKSSDGKADKGARGRKVKDRHVCVHSPCTKVFTNASELR